MIDDEDARHLEREGFVLLRNIMPRCFCRWAVTELEEWAERQVDLGNEEFRYRGWHPRLAAELAHHPDLALLTKLAQSLLDSELLPHPSIQFACRIPGERATKKRIDPHIDGRDHSETPKASRIQNFALNIGVFLNDVTEQDFGNLVVWPGSHLAYAAYFREFGPEAFMRQPFVEVRGQRSGFRSMPDVDLQPPRQLTGNRGDVVILNWHLGHAYVGNKADNTRFMMYARYYWAENTLKQKKRRLLHPWQDWSLR